MLVDKQPTTTEERCTLAQRFAKDFKMNVEFLVDDPEKGNPFEKTYACWPLRLYVVKEETMHWIAQPNDCSFDAAVADLMKLLKLNGKEKE